MSENNHNPTRPQNNKLDDLFRTPQKSSGEHIPTMPQKSESETATAPKSVPAATSEPVPAPKPVSAPEHIPTMPQKSEGENEPAAVQRRGAEHIATVPQKSGNEHVATMPQRSGNEGSGHIATMPQRNTSEHIATMPQRSGNEGSGHIATMPQKSTGEHIATVPQRSGSEHVATVPQTSASTAEHVATLPQAAASSDGHVATVPQWIGSQVSQSASRLIFTDVSFTDDAGTSYVIHGAQPISTDTGEAQIYRCSKADGKGDYVAKVLITLRPDAPASKLKTRKKIIGFLDKYKNSTSSHILPLLGHGTVKVNNEAYFVDVYPFCSGGDLGHKAGEFSLEKLKKDVIPAINSAIHLFHKEKLVHRDLKPDNLFYYKNLVVIGDFGITCELNTDDYAVDTEKIGTLGYFAPELLSEAARIESDYYAFGQTLWTLYHGEMMYKETIRSHGGFFSADARNAVNHMMQNEDCPGLDEIEKKDEFFEVLIRGLLQYTPKKRFGYKDVLSWLQGDKSLYMRVKTNRGDKVFERPIKVNGKECVDNEQVAQQLCDSWNRSIELLMDNTLQQQYKFTICRDKEADRIRSWTDWIENQTRMFPQGGMRFQNIALCRVIMELSENRIFCWRGMVFHTPAEISKAMGRQSSRDTFLCPICGDKLDTSRLRGVGICPSCGSKTAVQAENNFDLFYSLISTGLVADWLQVTGAADRKAMEELGRLQLMAGSSQMGMSVAFYWMYYMLKEDRAEAAYKECYSLSDIAHMLLKDAGVLYHTESNTQICCVEDPKLLGFISSLGYDEAVSVLLEDYKQGGTTETVMTMYGKKEVTTDAKTGGIEYKKQYELFFDMLEKNVEDEEARQLVRKAYYEFGPMSHLVWWKDNLGIYQFTGRKAKEIEKKVQETQIDPAQTIIKQRAALRMLEKEYQGFVRIFKINYLMGLAGIRKMAGRDCVYCGRLSGMLGYTFLSQAAPIGYKYFLKI